MDNPGERHDTRFESVPDRCLSTMPDIVYTTIKNMSLFESLVSLCIKSVNIVFCYSFSLSWISLWLKCYDHNLEAPVRLSRHYWRYAAIYGELNSPQIGADSHEFLVKIFAREYHGITISIYLYTFRSLYGNCIGMHKLLPLSKFMRFPTLFYNV